MGTDNIQGRSLLFHPVEPWPDPVNGVALLSDIVQFISRFVVIAQEFIRVLALWTAHTYAPNASEISPRLLITSPTKRCGKTRGLNVLEMLVVRPLPTSNVTPAAIFRSIEKYQPTMLVDEADTFLGTRGELRGILNAGHKRGGVVIRCVGDDSEPRAFCVFAPVAIACIGSLPDTLADRGIEIRMERRLKSQLVERFSARRVGPESEVLRRKLTRWLSDNLQGLMEADPKVPPGLNDRAEDNWRPLLAIADAAGGDWPSYARQAAIILSIHQDVETDVANVQLLADIQQVYQAKAVDRLPSKELADALAGLEDRPWSDWRHSKPINPSQVAGLLRSFGIKPRSIRLSDGRTPKGYLIVEFADAFSRYVPATAATPLSRQVLERDSSRHSKKPVAEEITRNPLSQKGCGGVADLNQVLANSKREETKGLGEERIVLSEEGFRYRAEGARRPGNG